MRYQVPNTRSITSLTEESYLVVVITAGAQRRQSMSKKEIHPRMITKSMKPFGTEPRTGDECFANGIFEFNITLMNAYIDSHPDEFQKVEIEVDGYYKFFERPDINRQYVEEADIDRPIILAEIAPDRIYHGYPEINNDFYSRGYNLIDGHHRLHKAHKMGNEKIHAWVLPMEQHCRFMYKGFEQYREYWNEKLGMKECK